MLKDVTWHIKAIKQSPTTNYAILSLFDGDKRAQAVVDATFDRLDAIYDQIERLKASVPRSNTHPESSGSKFDDTKTRYRGLMKNTAQIMTLFALGNLWMMNRALRKA